MAATVRMSPETDHGNTDGIGVSPVLGDPPSESAIILGLWRLLIV